MNLKTKITNLFKATTLSIDVNEHSKWRSSLYDESQFQQYNPDDLVQKKQIKIYRQMLRDEQVSGCLDIKKTIIYGSGWDIEAAKDDDDNEKANEQYQEHADYIKYCLTDGMKGSFRDNLREILSAWAYGFSITEMIIQVFKKGKFSGKIGFKHLKTRPPDSFDIHRNDGGDIIQIDQENGFIKIEQDDLKYFIIYSHKGEFGNPFGTSDLRRAYRAWWSKDNIYKFRNIYLERFGMGLVIAKYPRGMGDADRDVLKDMIDNIQVKTAFSIPKEVEIKIEEAAKRGEAGFHEALDREDKAIAKAILIPDKLGFTESDGGSYNLGENQFNLLFLLIENDRELIAETLINEQAIKFLIDLNYPEVDKYPKFKFKALTQKDKKAYATLIVAAIKEKVIVETEKDEEYLRDQLDLPKRDINDTVIERPAPVAPPGFGNSPVQQDENGNSIPVPSDEDKPLPIKEKFTLRRQPNGYEQKADFKAIDKKTAKFDYDTSIKMGHIITKLKDDLISSIIKKDVVSNKNYNFINNFTLKFLGDYRLFWKDILRKSFRMGEADAKVEVAKKVISLKGTGVLNMPPKEALKYFDSKAFWMTNVEEDFIKKHVKTNLFDGIKTGKSTDEVVYDLEEFFDKYKVEQLTSTGQLAKVADIPGRVEAIVRTNNNDTYNQGRLSMYRDPEVADFVPAYQYSAIMDARVSDICAQLDGKIYKANDPIWKEITPPNHFNCRSTIIPVLGDETYKPSKHISVELPEGFGNKKK